MARLSTENFSNASTPPSIRKPNRFKELFRGGNSRMSLHSGSSTACPEASAPGVDGAKPGFAKVGLLPSERLPGHGQEQKSKNEKRESPKQPLQKQDGDLEGGKTLHELAVPADAHPVSHTTSRAASHTSSLTETGGEENYADAETQHPIHKPGAEDAINRLEQSVTLSQVDDKTAVAPTSPIAPQPDSTMSTIHVEANGMIETLFEPPCAQTLDDQDHRAITPVQAFKPRSATSPANTVPPAQACFDSDAPTTPSATPFSNGRTHTSQQVAPLHPLLTPTLVAVTLIAALLGPKTLFLTLWRLGVALGAYALMCRYLCWGDGGAGDVLRGLVGRAYEELGEEEGLARMVGTCAGGVERE